MADEAIIEANGLWKRYGLPPFLPWKKRLVADHEWALRDISFTVPRGGSLGILGRNGAGKSTLLKLLAGVTPPDKGSIAVRGKIFPMIELAAGMSMELSGLENIRILGTIMGLQSQEIEKIIPEVEDFSELGDWLYKPVWQYSSGMMGRLAFGIAVHMRADIIIVDEVLSVGDAFFQRKCQQKMEALIEKGITLIFVTHNPYQMEIICDDAMLLDRGACVSYGLSSDVAKKYKYMLNQLDIPENANSDLNDPDTRDGSGDVRVANINLISQKNRENISQIETGCSFIVCISLILKKRVLITNIALRLSDGNNRLLYGIERLIDLSGKDIGEIIDLECLIAEFPLHGEIYIISVKISDGIMMDIVRRGAVFSSTLPEKKSLEINGIINLDATWLK